MGRNGYLVSGFLITLLVMASVVPVAGISSTAKSGVITKLEPVNVVDSDGDGRYTNFDVEVHADTRLPEADPDTSDPRGEPRLKVLVDGEAIAENIEVENRENLAHIVSIGSEHLPADGAENVEVTVVLWDDDTGYGGEEFDRSTISVPYESTERKTTRRTTSETTATTTETETTRTTKPTSSTPTETERTNSFSLIASRSVTVAGAPISFRTSTDSGYDLEIVEKPSKANPSLVTNSAGESTVFRASETGSYTVRAASDSGRTATAEITVKPQSDLVKKYAPILQYPAGTEYFPTRYEAFVHNSDLLRDDGFSEETVAQNPTMFDLADKSSEHYLELHGDEESYASYDERYPPSVYASVHENVAFEGQSYTAITYWLFYLYDPKAGGFSSLVAHQSDLETITILVNKSGPQWVGVSQHYGGERREWEKASKDGTHVRVYPALGAHSNYLRDTTKYDGEDILPQDQYTDKDGGTAEINDAFSIAYTDETGDRYTLRPDSRGQYQYEIVPLTGNEIWTTYEGGFVDEPGEGRIPMDRTRWQSPGTWFESDILPDENQVNAEIEATTVTPRSDEIEVTLEVENAGPKPNTFWAVVKANGSLSDSETAIVRKKVPLGTEVVTNETLSVPYPATNAEEIDVNITLVGVKPSLSESEDVTDWTTDRVENLGGTPMKTTVETTEPTHTTSELAITQRDTTSTVEVQRTTTRRAVQTPTEQTTEASDETQTTTTGSTPGFGILIGAASLGLSLFGLASRRVRG